MIKQEKKDILVKIAESPVLFIVLGIITLGGYLHLHIYKNQDNYNALSDEGEVVPNWMIFSSLAAYVLSGLILLIRDLFMSSMTLSNFNKLHTISNNVLLIVGIFMVIIAFKMKTILTNYTQNKLNKDLKMNGFLTVLFNIFYVNHKINQIVSGNIPGNQNSNNVPQDDITSQLEKLNDLKEKGILSQDEFNAKKQELLAKM